MAPRLGRGGQHLLDVLAIGGGRIQIRAEAEVPGTEHCDGEHGGQAQRPSEPRRAPSRPESGTNGRRCRRTHDGLQRRRSARFQVAGRRRHDPIPQGRRRLDRLHGFGERDQHGTQLG